MKRFVNVAAGKDAFRIGTPLQANPFNYNTKEWWEWRTGWLDADAMTCDECHRLLDKWEDAGQFETYADGHSLLLCKKCADKSNG